MIEHFGVGLSCCVILLHVCYIPAANAGNDWVWGAGKNKDSVLEVEPPSLDADRAEAVSATTDVPLAASDAPFEPFTDTPHGAVYVNDARNGSRQGRIDRQRAYAQVYGDPQVVNALEAGNDTQARFFIRDKLCNLGLLSCDEGYPPPPAPLHLPGGHPSGPLENLLYVQPVKVAPHGPPVPAVPLGSVRPQRPRPLRQYGAGPPYAGPVKSHYKPPKPVYTPPKPSYGAPKPSYGPPKPVYSAHEQPRPINYNSPSQSPAKLHHENHQPYKPSPIAATAVHSHVHHHTHYEHHAPGPAAYDINRSGERQQPAASGSHSIRPDGSDVVLNSIGSASGACVCVARYACAVTDIVNYRESRYSVDLSAISPRSRDTINITAYDDHQETIENVSTGERNTTEPKQGDQQEYLGDSEADQHTRRKRQTNENFSHLEQREFVTDVQGRQLGYRPNNDGCLHSDVCCSNPVVLNQQRRDGIGACGNSYASAINGRIRNYDVVEGETFFGEFPWQAAILEKDGGDNVYVCGATLISDQFLLTAAHCVDKYERYSLRVRLGEWDVNSENEFYGHQERDVSGLYIHPEYQRVNLFNDIAILRLSHPVELFNSAHISPVCLPSLYANFVGERCWATGWGKNAFGAGGNFQNVLKKVSLPVVSNSLCEQQLRNTRLGRSFRLHEGFMCAGGEAGKDACKGDGGGPLVCHHGGSYHLAGLVSWGVGCGQRDVPGVYVKVSQYLPWIESVTQSGSFPLGASPNLARQLDPDSAVESLVADQISPSTIPLP